MGHDIRDAFERFGGVAASLCAELDNLYAQGRTSDALMAIVQTLAVNVASPSEVQVAGQRRTDARIAA